MAEKIKTDVGILLLILIMETNLPIYFAKTELFLNFDSRNFGNKILCTLDTNM